MLTDDEILGLWSEGKTQKPMRPVLGSKKVIAFARNIEREAYRRAAAECRALAERYYDNGRTMQSSDATLRFSGMKNGALHCAEAIEALGREE